MQVLDAGVAQGFFELLACQVGMGVLGEALTSRTFCWVADQAVRKGAETNRRVRLKTHINIKRGVRGCGRGVVVCWRFGSRKAEPAAVAADADAAAAATEQEHREERRLVAGARVDSGLDCSGAVGGIGGGSGEEGFYAGETARVACLERVQSEMGKTGGVTSERWKGRCSGSRKSWKFWVVRWIASEEGGRKWRREAHLEGAMEEE